MPEVRITDQHSYKVGNDFIVTCKINQTWWAYYKSSSEIRETGENESEAIGNLIRNTCNVVVKVA